MLPHESAYQKAVQLQDTHGFICVLLTEICVLVFFCFGRRRGWYHFIELHTKTPMAAIIAYCCLIRAIEIHQPRFYQRWRSTLLRLERIYMLLLVGGDVMTFGYRFSRSALATEDLGHAFGYHQLRASPLVTTFRQLTLITGALGAIPTLTRLLPLAEQVALSVLLTCSMLYYLALPAALILQRPEYHRSNTRVCKLLLCVPDSDAFFPGACGPAAAGRLVLFAQLYTCFLAPVFLSFRNDQHLRLQREIDKLRALAVHHNMRYQPPRQSWWTNCAITIGGLLYLALVTWRFVIDYDQVVFDHLAAAQEWATLLAARLSPYVSLAALRS